MTGRDRTHFEDVIAKMPKYLQELQSCQVIAKNSNGTLSPALHTDSGIYVFYENGQPMYVGRSDRLGERLHEHSRPSSGETSASFAFNIAREQFIQEFREEFIFEYVELLKAELGEQRALEKLLTTPLDTLEPASIRRKTLQEIPAFTLRFRKAKKRVRHMTIRVVEIQDPIEQTIFEVYTHTKLGTPFNTFENH